MKLMRRRQPTSKTMEFPKTAPMKPIMLLIATPSKTQLLRQPGRMFRPLQGPVLPFAHCVPALNEMLLTAM